MEKAKYDPLAIFSTIAFFRRMHRDILGSQKWLNSNN